MPCPLHALLTPRGSVTFRTMTIRPRNLHSLKAVQSPICTTQSRPMAGHKSQRRNPHPSRRRQRHERLRIDGEGQARCKTGNATIPGHSIEPSSSPPPLARPPKVTFYVCRAFGRFAEGSSFQAAEAAASGRANERRSKPIPTCTFLVVRSKFHHVPLVPFPSGRI